MPYYQSVEKPGVTCGASKLTICGSRQSGIFKGEPNAWIGTFVSGILRPTLMSVAKLGAWHAHFLISESSQAVRQTKPISRRKADPARSMQGSGFYSGGLLVIGTAQKCRIIHQLKSQE